jgi:hypothetical protein
MSNSDIYKVIDIIMNYGLFSDHLSGNTEYNNLKEIDNKEYCELIREIYSPKMELTYFVLTKNNKIENNISHQINSYLYAVENLLEQKCQNILQTNGFSIISIIKEPLIGFKHNNGSIHWLNITYNQTPNYCLDKINIENL